MHISTRPKPGRAGTTGLASADQARPSLADLRVRIFADGGAPADVAAIRSLPYISGFTTNPTLFRAAGIDNYIEAVEQFLHAAAGGSVSIEVLSDDPEEMIVEARTIRRVAQRVAGSNLYVKIPVTTTDGRSTAEAIGRLVDEGVRVNVTGIFTREQIDRTIDILPVSAHAYVSIFAGRIADTGRDPVPTIEYALARTQEHQKVDVLWASPREVLNIFQADEIGCDIITATHDLLRKLPKVGHDLESFSRETIQMFRTDAIAAGYKL